jgi:hypothetical protein
MSKQEMEQVLEAMCGLGAIGNGYCFCSHDRDPDKIDHEPECRDMRIAIVVLTEAIKQRGEPPACECGSTDWRDYYTGTKRTHKVCAGCGALRFASDASTPTIPEGYALISEQYLRRIIGDDKMDMIREACCYPSAAPIISKGLLPYLHHKSHCEMLDFMEAGERCSCGLEAMLSATSETKGEDKILSDDELIEIRDSLLPSQGESFDMLAFGRLVAASAKRKALLKVEEIIMSSMSNSVLHLKEISRMIKETK